MPHSLRHCCGIVAMQLVAVQQHASPFWADGMQVVPRIIAENSGLNATDVVSSLHAAHANGQQTAGLSIETGQPKDLAGDGILDLYSAKWWALKLATDAVVTVLRVDQIIMAKQAGGPKPRQGAGDDED